MQYLVIAALIAVVYFFFIKKKPISKQESKEESSKSNDMVECSACGIYCDVNESILSNGKYYCSSECVEKK